MIEKSIELLKQYISKTITVKHSLFINIDNKNPQGLFWYRNVSITTNKKCKIYHVDLFLSIPRISEKVIL